MTGAGDDWLVGEGGADAVGPERVTLPAGRYVGLDLYDPSDATAWSWRYDSAGDPTRRPVRCPLCGKLTSVEIDVTVDGLYGVAAEHTHGPVGTGWSDPPAPDPRPTPYGSGPWLRFVLGSLAEFMGTIPFGTLDDEDGQAVLAAVLDALDSHVVPIPADPPPTEPAAAPAALEPLQGPLDGDYRVPVDPRAYSVSDAVAGWASPAAGSGGTWGPDDPPPPWAAAFDAVTRGRPAP